MNFKTLAPLIGEPMAAFVINGHNVVTKTLTQEQQAHLVKHWQELPQWLGTEEGQIALKTLFADWLANCKL